MKKKRRCEQLIWPPGKLDTLQPLPLVVQVQVEGAGEEEWKLQKENLIWFP